jgi:hypothetical protein
MGRMTIAAPPHNNQTINVILFGEPGAGKSAVVNLIARKNLARVPSGVHGSTLQSTRYDIPVDGVDVRIFETIGLPVPVITGNDYLIALENAYDFINKLVAAGGVHLLLFCIRATRLTATIQSNYRLFSEAVPPTKVPIALVFTGLEGEVKMEDWWTRNKAVILERYGLKNDGHACVTGVTDRTQRQDLNYTESQKVIRELLKRCRIKPSASIPEPRDWFLRLENGMQAFVDKNRKPTRGDLMNMLSTRLRLDSKTVKEFLDIMERGDAHPSSRDGEVRPQDAPLARIQHRDTKGEADFPKSDTTPKSRDLNAGKWDNPPRAGTVEISRTRAALDAGKQDNEPLRKRASSEVAMPRCRDPDATGKEDKNSKWDDGARRREITAGKAKAEPQTMNTQAEKYVKSDAGVSMDDIRSNFPHDLTGYVARSSQYPFASGSYGDIYRGKFSMRGKLIDVRYSFSTRVKLNSH